MVETLDGPSKVRPTSGRDGLLHDSYTNRGLRSTSEWSAESSGERHRLPRAGAVAHPSAAARVGRIGAIRTATTT